MQVQFGRQARTQLGYGGPGLSPPPAKPECSPLEQKIIQIELFMGYSVGFKYAKNALAAAAPPRTSLGELTTLSQSQTS